MRSLLPFAVLVVIAGCGGSRDRESPPPRPWILLVTLDTTRADAVGPGAAASTPAFTGLAARARVFRQAYATVPETLPSHLSLMTGLYPAGHGVHENGRTVPAAAPLLAERLRQQGYRTSAFVSSFVLASRFGLARGFETYDDRLAPGAVERRSEETAARAIEHLRAAGPEPQLAWVHFFDPHTPYDPPAPYRQRHPDNPYLGEIEAMDAALGRVVEVFEAQASRHKAPAAIVVVGDHGEGLGDHGEQQHGYLVYDSTMRVPLVVAGPGITPGAADAPVSSRHVFHTILDWAGVEAAGSLRSGSPADVVLGEGMKPFLSFGWQPQVMAVQGRQKAILAGRIETYNLEADPAERRDLGSVRTLPDGLRRALDDYPVPSIDARQPPSALSDEARRSLASLGYVSGTATPVVRRDAPRPADMVALFPLIDQASTLFVQERYARAIPVLKKILAADPHNLDAVLRLATAHSSLGQNAAALEAFRRAATLAPKSSDARLYLALHYARGDDWARAVPALERIVEEQPERSAAVEGLATVREKAGRLAEAVRLRQKAYTLRPATAAEYTALGRLAMEAGETVAAIDAFEHARRLTGPSFAHDLELGVVYLDARRLTEAREALDRIPPSHDGYAMALFKRAQVSVLLNEPDRAERIDRARRGADATTRALIERERLFR